MAWAIALGLNDGWSGQGLQFQITNPAYFSRYPDPEWGESIAFICLGGNDLDVLGRTAAEVLADMQTLGEAMYAAGYETVVVCDIADRTSYTAGEQADRAAVNASLAAGVNFLDGIHPTAAGLGLYADDILAVFTVAGWDAPDPEDIPPAAQTVDWVNLIYTSADRADFIGGE